MGQYASTPERERVLSKHPDYAVELTPADRRMVARVGDLVIADSDRALCVRESFHAEVIYFPPAAVNFEHLQRTDHHTRCPFKGDASYYSIRADSGLLVDAAWVYETPMPEVAGLQGYLAFYPDRVVVGAG